MAEKAPSDVPPYCAVLPKRTERVIYMKRMVLILALLLCALARAETFLVTSDLHLTEDRDAHRATLAALRAAARHADAVLLLGDSTNNAHDGEHAAVLEFLASLDCPAYILPGNHDITLDISDFIELYVDYGWSRAFSRDEATASCAVMTAGGACLLLLDTNDRPGYVAPLGGISQDTIDWTVRTLAALPEGAPVVACGHHPILPEAREQRTPGADGLAGALKDVKLYLCGHDHGFAAVRVGGLQQITVGQPQAYPGWAGLLTVSQDGLHWQVIELYDAPTRQAMADRARDLGRGMARGTLAGTVHEGDGEAIDWFAEALDRVMTSRLTEETCREMLTSPAARKWREIETKTVVKKWIFGLLENCPQDVRRIDLPY